MYTPHVLHPAALRPAVQVVALTSLPATMANMKTLFVMFVGHAEWFKAHLSQFFCGFWLIGYILTSCPNAYIDVEIWCFLWWRWQTTMDKTNHITPCTCMQGNNLIHMIQALCTEWFWVQWTWALQLQWMHLWQWILWTILSVSSKSVLVEFTS